LNKLSELVVYLKKKGLKETFLRIKSRYFSITEFVLFRNDLTNSSTTLDEVPDIEHRLGELEELKRCRHERSDLPREFYVDQTHGGKEFYLGYYKGELAQICWVFRRGEYSRFFKFANESSRELNYIVTLTKFRKMGLPAIFTDYLCASLKANGVNVVVVGIAASNTNMIRGMKNTDFYEFKRVVSFLSFVKKTTIG